ncbi:MAG TPA: hypothetical protein VGE13_02820 [Candidatus Saccharimonadales bacterium]
MISGGGAKSNLVVAVFFTVVAVAIIVGLSLSQTEEGFMMRAILASFAGASILVGIIIFLGKGTGRGYTSVSLTRLKRQGVVRPEYEKFGDCTPAEFGMIIDGRCDRDEMIAEIIHLYLRGYIMLEKDQNGKIISKMTPNVNLETTSDIDKLLLGAIANNRLPDVWRFEEVVMDSLRAKEWVIERQNAMGIMKRLGKWLIRLSVFTKVFLTIFGVLFVVPALGFMILAVTAGGEDLFTYAGADSAGAIYAMSMLIGVMASLLLITLGLPVVLAVVAATYTFVESFRGVTIIARNYSPKYEQHYRDVIGLRQYLAVSGMDTMTPDYATLDFKGLDPLYPYAIAADLDKTITRMF